MRTLLVSLILAGAALAGDCGNCQGQRIVGHGPVRLPCPVCGGSGTAADQPAPPAQAEPAAAAEETTPAAAVDGRPRPVVCRVTAAHGPSRSSGSGVLVQASGSTAVVITAWHVVRGNRDSIVIAWPDGTQSAARVVASDDTWDLCALRTGRPAASPVTIAASAPRRGDRLTIAGYGPAGKYLEQTGPVTQYLSPTSVHVQQFIELRASARQGDSGGPIFDDQGELAGVLFGERGGLTVGSCSTRVALFLATVPAPAVTCSVCEAKP